MGSIFSEKKADTTKTTCIEITAETYKCIDISAYVPTCIMITSNVPTSEYYEKPRQDLEITVAPELQIALINNAAPVLNVNMDANGVYYVTDFDVVYIDITNWNANAEYVNIFSNQDGDAAVVFLDEVEQRIVWALDDYALDGTQMWLNAQAKESDKLISPQSSVTVTQMEQTDQPNLSSWVSQTEQTVLNITILDYDATYTYSDPIVTGGTAVRTDNIIAWTLPALTADAYHEISITATAPLMYESLAGVSGGTVVNFTAANFSAIFKSICDIRSSNISAYKTIIGPNVLTGNCEVQGVTSATIITGPYEIFNQKVTYNTVTNDISLTPTHTAISIAPSGYYPEYMYWDEDPSWTYSHWLDAYIDISYNGSTNILTISHSGNWYLNDAVLAQDSCSISGCTPTGVECIIARYVLRTANYSTRLNWVQSNETNIMNWIHSTIGPITPTIVYA